MRAQKSKRSKYATADGYAYLTKRTLVSKAKAAGVKAAETAMEIMGYTVVKEGDWIVKKYADGRQERLSPL
jgi:hypothetical protein